MHHFVAEICWKMVHCGLFVLCIVEFVIHEGLSAILDLINGSDQYN